RRLLESRQQGANTLGKNIAGLSAAIESRAFRLSELRSAALPLASEWSIAAGEKPITRETLDALPQEVVKLAERLAKGAVELRAADDNLRKADEARERDRQAVAQGSKLNELQVTVRRLSRIERRRGQLEQAVTLLRETREEFINRQIQPL